MKIKANIIGIGEGIKEIIEYLKSNPIENSEIVDKVDEKLKHADIVIVLLDENIDENILNEISNLTKDTFTIYLANENSNKLSKDKATIIIKKDNKSIYQTIKAILDMLNDSNENDIAIDLNDLKHIISYDGIIYVKTENYVGEEAALNAIKKALENIDLKNSKGILLNFEVNENYPLINIENGMDFIYENSNEDADIIFSLTTNNNLSTNEVKVIY